jgi:hypothetical protein
MLSRNKKAGSNPGIKQFAAHEVKNLWALSQMFLFYGATPWGDNSEEFRIVFEPKPDTDGLNEVGPNLFAGVQRIVFDGISWPVQSVVAAGTESNPASPNFGRCLVVFKVDDATLSRTERDNKEIMLEEGRKEIVFRK